MFDSQPVLTEAARAVLDRLPPPGNPRNENIPVSVARLVDSETGTLGAAVNVKELLGSLDRKKYYLELVEREPEPIVKIMDRKEQYERQKARRARSVLNRPPEEKELQLTWRAAAGDLHVKLRKAREDLADGHRVTIVFAPKHGQAPVSPEEQQSIIEDTVRVLADVGKERSPPEMKRNATAIFIASLRPRKQVIEVEWAYEDDEDEDETEWVGLRDVEEGLRKGARVEVIFNTPPPPKKAKRDAPVEADPQAVDPELVRQRLEDTVTRLQELGTEWRKRDVRKRATVVYLEATTIP